MIPGSKYVMPLLDVEVKLINVSNLLVLVVLLDQKHTLDRSKHRIRMYF